MIELFEKFESDQYKFEDVEHKMSQRPDIHALMMLDKLAPNNSCAIVSTDYDVVYLAFDPDIVSNNVTEDQVRDLVRCGVLFDGDGFRFFV